MITRIQIKDQRLPIEDYHSLFSILITTILGRIAIPEGISIVESPIVFVMFQRVNIASKARCHWPPCFTVIPATGRNALRPLFLGEVILRRRVWTYNSKNQGLFNKNSRRNLLIFTQTDENFTKNKLWTDKLNWICIFFCMWSPRLFSNKFNQLILIPIHIQIINFINKSILIRVSLKWNSSDVFFFWFVNLKSP